MKTIYTLVYFLGLFFSKQPCFAQSETVANKNLTWFSDHNIEKHSGLDMNTEVKIIIRTTASIELSEQGQIMNFSVQSVSGTWQNENEDGSLTYSILYNNVDAGSLTIQRSNGTAKITIDFTEANADGMHQEYFISRVEAN